MRANLYLFTCIVFFVSCSLFTKAQIISTYAGDGSVGYSGDDGPATDASFNVPTTIALNAHGVLFVNDQGNNRVRRIMNNGSYLINTFVGTGVSGFYGNNIPADSAELRSNWGIATDVNGNLYIADQDNNCIRKVDTFGIITTFAGIPGSTGSSGDGGPATLAVFTKPLGIAADKHGNIFVSDQYEHVIRKINSGGVISTVAGRTGVSGYSGDDGAATNATFGLAWGISVDSSGDLFICDEDHNNVRKVTPAGIISTFAGSGTPGFYGDGLAATVAKLNFPVGVCADLTGDVFIADAYNNRVRKVSAGIITTVAGNGAAGFGGDGGLATAAALYQPTAVNMDDSGNLYINDLGNVRIRKIKKIDLLYFTHGHTQNISVCENAFPTNLDSSLAAMDFYTGLTDTWNAVSGPYHGRLALAYSTLSADDTLVPAGITYTPDAGYAGFDTLCIRVHDGMAADSTTIYVSVNRLVIPAGAITGPSGVCPGASVVLTDTLKGGTWLSTNGNASASFLPNDTDCIITGFHTGLDTISYTVSSVCGSGVTTKIITIYPLPDTGAISGPDNVCAGDSIRLLESVNGGSWSGSNLNTALEPDDSSVIIRSLQTGNEIINYTVSNLFCTSSASFLLTVNPLPFVGSIEGPSDICLGTEQVYSDSASSGIWSSTTTRLLLNSGPNSSTEDVTAVSVGTDTLLYIVNTFCGTATAAKTINIDSLPQQPTIVENQYTLSVPQSYPSYQWTLNGTAVPGATSDTFIVVEAGAYAVNVSGANGCIAASPTINCPDCGPGEIKIYPNPSSSVVNIEWCKKVTVKIVCMDGKIFKVTDATNEVDLHELPDGVYVLVLYNENGLRVLAKTITKLSQN